MYDEVDLITIVEVFVNGYVWGIIFAYFWKQSSFWTSMTPRRRSHGGLLSSKFLESEHYFLQLLVNRMEIKETTMLMA